MQAFNELWAWLAGLDPTFAFLVALPFLIGALGLASIARERGPSKRPLRASAGAGPATPHAHV